MNALALTVDHLCVSRRGQTVIENVSARFLAGEITAICGPNGAGKSTLVQAVAGLLPYQGDIRFAEAGAPGMDELAYLPQGVAVRSNLSVFEIVLLGRIERLGWRVAGADLDAAARALSATGLEAFAQRPIGSLSGGQQQLALLAQRLVREPKILLVDEPTSALDLRRQLLVLDMLSRYAVEQNAVVVTVLQDLSLAARFAASMLMLDHGRVIAAGTAPEVIDPPTIRSAYGVEAEILTSSLGHPCVAPMRPTNRFIQLDSDTGRRS